MIRWRFIFFWSLLMLVLPAHGQSTNLTWAGTPNLGQKAVGSVTGTSLSLTNNSASPIAVDLEIRGLNAGDPVSEFAIFVTPTPTSSPEAVLQPGASVPIALNFTPTQAGTIAVDITALDTNGNSYDFPIEAAAILLPAPILSGVNVQ
jgi:hypothetical protein